MAQGVCATKLWKIITRNGSVAQVTDKVFQHILREGVNPPDVLHITNCTHRQWQQQETHQHMQLNWQATLQRHHVNETAPQ